jgi:hypothetical protein
MTEKTTIPRTQRGWLIIYWVALGINLLLFLEALLNASEFAFTSLVAVTLATASTLVGAIFATKIVRAGVSTTAFVKGTTTVRAIAVAWILIELAIVSGTIVAVLANLESSDVDWSGGFASTVGSISILAVLASGFSEYREAMGGAKKPLT